MLLCRQQTTQPSDQRSNRDDGTEKAGIRMGVGVGVLDIQRLSREMQAEGTSESGEGRRPESAAHRNSWMVALSAQSEVPACATSDSKVDRLNNERIDGQRNKWFGAGERANLPKSCVLKGQVDTGRPPAEARHPR